MRALIVLAHPEPASTNGRLARAAADELREAGFDVDLDDLYAEGFDPLEGPAHFSARVDPERFDAQSEQRHAWQAGTTAADVLRELERVERADLLVFQYPLWWHAQPAMLKGWLDRVLVYGGTYTARERYDRGRYRGKRALLSVTLGAPAETYAYNGRNGDVELLLWPMAYTLYYVGLDVLEPFVGYEISGAIAYGDADPGARRDACERDLRARLRSLDDERPLPFNGFDDLDERGRLRPGVAGRSAFIRDDPSRIPNR